MTIQRFVLDKVSPSFMIYSSTLSSIVVEFRVHSSNAKLDVRVFHEDQSTPGSNLKGQKQPKPYEFSGAPPKRKKITERNPLMAGGRSSYHKTFPKSFLYPVSRIPSTRRQSTRLPTRCELSHVPHSQGCCFLRRTPPYTSTGVTPLLVPTRLLGTPRWNILTPWKSIKPKTPP